MKGKEHVLVVRVKTKVATDEDAILDHIVGHMSEIEDSAEVDISIDVELAESCGECDEPMVGGCPNGPSHYREG